MKNNQFCHLHLHNEYSYLDGYGSSKKYIAKAKELGFNYIALTNHGNCDGLLQWQKECDKQSIPPVLGCEAYIVPDRFVKQKETRGHISLLIRNETGWKTLCSILTEANLTGFYHKPRIDYNLLLNSDLSGLIIMTACAGSFLKLPGSTQLMEDLVKKTEVYFEIMPHNINAQNDIHNYIKKLRSRFIKIPFVATNDCHYIEKDEWEAQEMLLAINSNANWDDPKRWKFGFKGLHLRTADEMINAFQRQGDWPEDIVKQAMANTIKIARQCFQFRIPKQEISLPRSPLAKNVKNELALLDSICKEGYEKIFRDNDWPQEYKDRYLQEWKLIQKKKFERYFLIVYDLVNWARDNNIAVGPGRGSVGGSLIAFLMGITQVDPIKFKLSFSRFISEERQDLPDIDIDFEKRHRSKVIEYLEEIYGKYNTCGISTDMKMQSRAAIRDVCRVMNIPSKAVSSFANSIWQREHNNNSAIQSSIDNTKEGKYFAKRYPDTVRLALKMEGQIRNSGAHAAAVIISKEDLSKSDKCVLIKRNNRIICNWNMEDSEYVGLMKLDVLGLSTLSVLSEAKRLINKKDNLKALFHDRITDNHLFLGIMEREFEEKYKSYTQIDFDFNKIPLEDEETFEKISAGETSGMFQLSGHSCTELCKKMKVHSFEDIIAIIALARPGPADSGMTDDYITRKHGKKWEAMHPIYEEVTKDTYGLLVYQEQVMQVISKVAGLSESIADGIRKVIGKKRDPEEFKPFFKQFLQGCKKMKTLSQKEAEDFWEGLLNWASYGFNRCLTGDTLLTRSSFNQYTGKHISIEKLYLDWNSKTPVGDKYRIQGLQILQMCDDKRCRPGRIIGIFYQGLKTVYKITTKTGKEIKGTYNHKLLTFDGYKKIEELSIGERLAIMSPYQQTITEKKGQKWKKVYMKGKEGFQKGQNNPAYIDGRTNFLEKAKEEVLLRSSNKCEKCSIAKSKRFEFAHIKSLKECNDDYQKYHSKNNILYLCNNCHKKLDYIKGERKRRYSRGYSIYYDSIISIECLKKEDVFDIEMESPFHNFIANDIVSHNSHATAYALIGYWTAYLKTHCEKEFYAASLTYGEWNEKASDSNKHKNSLLAEIRQTGYEIISPKREYSDITKWVFHDEKLYIPFTEIIGVGESNASKCLAPVKQNRLQGFFGADYDADERQNTKINQLLKELKVDDPDITSSPKILSKYLPHIDLQGNKAEKYPNLEELFGGIINSKYFEDVLILNLNANEVPANLIQRRRFRLNKQIIQCNGCNLRKQVKKRPVLSSVGLFNVTILLEAPGKDEDEEGRGAVGSASNVLWDELSKYEYFRRFFHLTNCCRCWPSKTKTPNYMEISACYKWLYYELKKLQCRLILACGNVPLYALTGRKGGITDLSGTTEWVENVGAWICWCVHPSAVLRNRKQNLGPFQDGIKNFIEKLELLKGE